MLRTQIQLTDQQARRLRRIAREEGISVAEVVRRCIDHATAGVDTERSGRYARAATLIGTFADREKCTDLAAEHDRHLDKTFG